MKSLNMKLIAMSLMLIPLCADAAAVSSPKLTNNSDQYYLVQDKVFSAKNCLKVAGNKKLNSGDSSALELNKGCKWGVVTYKAYNISSNQYAGSVAYSFRDGHVNLELSTTCAGNPANCTFKSFPN